MYTFLATLSGAGFITWIDSILAPGWPVAESMFATRLASIGLGNLVASLILALILAWKFKPGAGFCAGGVLALGPIVQRIGLPFEVAFYGCIALAFVAAWGARTWTWSKPAIWTGTGLAAAAPLLGLFILPLSYDSFRTDPPPELRPAKDVEISAAGQADVVLILADTLRADAILATQAQHYAVSGDGLDLPNLRRMMEEGTWAVYATTPSNQTLPSHLALLAALDIERIGMRDNRHRWPTTELLEASQRDFNPLAQRFSDAGYRTVGIAANELLSRVHKEAGHHPFDAGFEVWHGQIAENTWEPFNRWMRDYTWWGWFGYYNKYPRRFTAQFMRLSHYPHERRLWRMHHGEGRRTTDNALTYMQELEQSSQPYFFFLHYMDPHSPYIPDEPWHGQVTDQARLPEGAIADVSGEFEMRVRLRQSMDGRMEKQPEAELGAYLRDLYREEVLQFDAYLGEILDHLRDNGRDTYILFTSDHGEMFGEHQQVEHGKTLYELETAVPFILLGPDVPAGRKLNFAPELVDAGYTLLELAGLETKGAAGRNVLDGNGEVRPTLTMMLNRCAVREGKWKLMYRLEYSHYVDTQDEAFIGKKPERLLKPESLFNLEQDPEELHNLLGQEPEVEQRLQAWLEQRLQYDLLPQLPERVISARHQEKLDELGYTEDGVEDGH